MSYIEDLCDIDNILDIRFKAKVLNIPCGNRYVSSFVQGMALCSYCNTLSHIFKGQ